MNAQEILDYLATNEAVLTGGHFVYTSDNHGPAYINMRQVAHDAGFMAQVGEDMADRLAALGCDLVLGPETLGRTLAGYVGAKLGIPAIWCEIIEVGGIKNGVFNPKLDFQRLLPGKRVVIVDDLLTTGGSIHTAAIAARDEGADVVGAACVVRRSPDVDADKCGVPKLEVLAEVSGFEMLTANDCMEHGPCSRNVPIIRRPGHGWKWEQNHSDYQGGFV